VRPQVANGGRIAIVTQNPTAFDADAAVRLDGDVAVELPAVLGAPGEVVVF